jgi:hypothetical protein
VMIDDLAAAGEPATYQWLLHALEAMQLDESARRVTVRRGDAGLRVQFVAPAELRFSQQSGWDPPPDQPETAPPQFHFTASTTEPAAAARIVAVLMPFRREQESSLPATIKQIDAEGGTAVQIGDDTILIKHPHADEVRAAGHCTTAHAAVFRKE